MHGFRLTAPLLLPLLVGCATAFADMRTPSGEYCSDMQVIAAGQVPDQEYHRIGPVQSAPEARTEAERLESLRKAACGRGGDAVVEAVNEEIRLPNAGYGTVSAGTAVTWTRRSGDGPKPLAITPPKPAPEPTATPEAPPEETAAPVPSAAPTTAKTARPMTGTTPSAKPSVTPFGSTTSKPPPKKP